MNDLQTQLLGFRLTTAEILYHLPDHPTLLQSYIWQAYDLAPKYPTLLKFIEFWRINLDGELHSVRVASKNLISCEELHYAGTELTLH